MSTRDDDDDGTMPEAAPVPESPLPQAALPGTASAQTALRVMTWNLHGLARQDGVSQRAATAAAVAVVRAARPDVLAVQEPPRGFGAGWRWRRFAARTGMRVAVGGAKARIALLVAPSATVTGAHLLPMPWREPQVRRNACLAQVDGVLVAVVHLGLRVDERDEQLAAVLAAMRAAQPWVGAASGAAVLAGDLNAAPTARAWQQALAAGLRDAYAPASPTFLDPSALTFPAADPGHRIDAVLVGAGLSVLAATVPDDPLVAVASDHRPVVVDLVAR